MLVMHLLAADHALSGLDAGHAIGNGLLNKGLRDCVLLQLCNVLSRPPAALLATTGSCTLSMHSCRPI